MKKRLTSVLLTICMVVCLFSGMAVTAHADNVETIEYTLKQGENVYSVCKSLGIDFHANYDWITKTNNITNYSSLPVGRKIILPLGNTSGVTPGGTTSGTTSAPVAGSTNVKLLTDDKVVSYLVPHVVSAGETLYDLCIAKGLDYNKNIDTILKLNNLKNANRIAVGRTLLFPSDTTPASGTCIAVVSHKVVAGDATYNLCGSYGINYADNLELMKVLNSKKDMASIKTGQQLLIPVPATVVPGSNNSGNAGNNNAGNNSGNTNNNNNNNNSGSTDSSTVYKITQNTTNVNQGSYSILVNAESGTTAKAGDTVTVNVSAKNGYRLDYVKVVDAKNNNVTVNSTSFKMPASDVTVSVYFVADADYRITRAYSAQGTFTTSVNGAVTDEAAEGQTVYINAEPKYGYELESITVYRSSNKATTVTVSDKSFVMPKYDVTVSVTFRTAYNHTIECKGSTVGSVSASLNGSEVTKAKAGDIITVNAQPKDGYSVGRIEVTADNGNTVTVDSSNRFVMPECNVSIQVHFSADEFNVISSSTTNGSYTVSSTSAKAGAWMQVVPTPDAGYVVDKVYYTDSNGDKVEIKSSDYSFTMPARDTTISVSFRMRPYYFTVDAHTKLLVNGAEVENAKMGETVTIQVTPTTGYSVKSIEVKRTSGGKVIEVEDNEFVMPAGNVTVTVTYEVTKYNLTVVTPGGYGNAEFEVGGVKVTKAEAGQTVKISPKPDSGYYNDSVSVTCNGTDVSVNTSTGEFTMPSGDAWVELTFARS